MRQATMRLDSNARVFTLACVLAIAVSVVALGYCAVVRDEFSVLLVGISAIMETAMTVALFVAMARVQGGRARTLRFVLAYIVFFGVLAALGIAGDQGLFNQPIRDYKHRPAFDPAHGNE